MINRIQNILKIYGEQSKVNKTARTEKTSSSMKKDEVILSSKAQGASQIYQAIYSLPEIREDKVNELSQRIAAGTYYVDANDIAGSMLKRNPED